MERDRFHELTAAYLATRYEVIAPDRERLVLRVGELHPELDRRLAVLGVAQWAFLTAFNPWSEPLSEAENDLRQEALFRKLDAEAYARWPGAGIGATGEWPPEPSVLVLGLDEDVARRLSREFQQNAWVQGAVGGPARLLWVKRAF